MIKSIERECQMTTFTIKEIAKRFNLPFAGNGNIEITGLCGLSDNLPNCLSFLNSSKLLTTGSQSNIPAFVTKPDLVVEGKTNIFSDNPELDISKIAELFVMPPMQQEQSIAPTAVIGKNCELADDITLGPNVVIGDNVKIAKGTIIMAGVVIMDNVSIGESCKIYPNVTIREACQIHNRVIIQPGTVIGSDGYGFVSVAGTHHKIPQIGIVVIEDDVEIGANCGIDRGRFNETRIGRGTKIDNLVHIGHNVIIGENCLIVAFVGISGSTQLGNNVTLAGKVGIAGHIKITDNVTCLAVAGVTKSITEPGIYAGYPAKPAKLWHKAIARFYRE